MHIKIDLRRSSNNIFIWINKARVYNEPSWILSSQGMLKWNVDAFIASMDPQEIDGVLMDYEGKFLCIFSYSTCIKESNEVEVLSIQKILLPSIHCCYVFS